MMDTRCGSTAAAWIYCHNSPYARSGGRQDRPRCLRRAHGFLVDGALELIEDKFPSLSVEEQASLTAAELKKMSANGITSLMDARVGPNGGGRVA